MKRVVFLSLITVALLALLLSGCATLLARTRVKLISLNSLRSIVRNSPTRCEDLNSTAKRASLIDVGRLGYGKSRANEGF